MLTPRSSFSQATACSSGGPPRATCRNTRARCACLGEGIRRAALQFTDIHPPTLNHVTFLGAASQVYVVSTVVSTGFTLLSAVSLSKAEMSVSAYNGQNVPIYRLTGGRGYAYDSRVACTSDSAQVICPAARVPLSGSMQSKLQNIPNALTAGVAVARDGPDAYGGYTWRVTFLDEALPGATNFALSVAAGPSVVTSNGIHANITIAKLMDGIVNPPCTGALQVPTDKALAIGQYYWARVFAINEVRRPRLPCPLLSCPALHGP